jgi:hypothetical protein
MNAGIPWIAATTLALLVLGSPEALLAGQSGSIMASGVVLEDISLDVPPPQLVPPEEIASDGRSMAFVVPEPVTITANVPGLMELSQVQVDPPNGLSEASVWADITLIANGSPLVVASSNGSGSGSFDAGFLQASVRARFYSTTDTPLPAGAYTAITVLTVVAE